MADTWLISILWTSPENMDRIILVLVKPVIENFSNDIRTFHFFREPGHFLFRVMCDEQRATMIKTNLEERLNQLMNRNLITNFEPVRVDPTYTEANSFGPENCQNVYKFFEYGSRLSIKAIDYRLRGVRAPSEFNEGKFTHCLLNQWRYGVEGEAHFHLNRVGERLLWVLSNFRREAVERCLREVSMKLERDVFPIIVDIVRQSLSTQSTP